MNLFDKLVTEALKNQPHLSPLRMVVEKELLHHDILRVLSQHNLTAHLTFMGGTCLRCCYGGIRLSEDLDFTGGSDFTKENLSSMGQLLIENLNNKYELVVRVSEPTKEKHNVDTWKIKIETRPLFKNMPAQRINIDICAVPSYERCPMMLLNPYRVDMGTSGLIIQAQSREEIYADKLLAFAFRPNRIKYRDIWDMIWLHSQGLKPRFELIPLKLLDRHLTMEQFLKLFQEREKLMAESNDMASEFAKEMSRFVSGEEINKTFQQNDTWAFINYLVHDLRTQIQKTV